MPSVGEIRMQYMWYWSRLIVVDRGGRGGCLEDYISDRMDAVAVFLPLSQFAANKSNSYHCTVTTDHFGYQLVF